MMPTLSTTRFIQELAFEEARDLVRGCRVSVFDGLYRVGKHCSVTVAATPLEGGQWRIQFHFQAFEPDLVDWSELRLILGDTARVERLSAQLHASGTAEQKTDLVFFDLSVHRVVLPILSTTKDNLTQPDLPSVPMAASSVESHYQDSEALPFRSPDLDLDFWVLQSGDELHVVVATAELRSDLQGKQLKLLLIRKTTGDVLPALTMRPLEWYEVIPTMSRFSLRDLSGKAGWFRYEEFRAPIDQAFSILLTEG